MADDKPETLADVVRALRTWADHVGDDDDTYFEWTVSEMRACIRDYADRIERAGEMEKEKARLDILTDAVGAVEAIRDSYWDAGRLDSLTEAVIAVENIRVRQRDAVHEIYMKRKDRNRE